ncbi:MAG: nitroreductase family deazaflavin-dependent oxidoreductase [Dehalococcoidia bacterium]
MTTGSGNRPQWVQDHIRRYLESNGEDGHEWRGVTTLLLTTKGRKSGESTTTPLIYGRSGERYLVVASRGGAAHHPQWYLNLSETPDVQVQVEGERFAARARTATAEEKPALWAIMAGIWPAYDEYQTKTSRVIPVVVLDRVP